MKVVIIGNHAAGLSAAQTLRTADDAVEIVVLSNENVPPYSRCLIPYVVSGQKDVDGILHKSPDFYKRCRINALLGVEAAKVLTSEQAVLLADGRKIGYDHLVIASGGTPSMPRLPGIENEGVFGFRTLADAVRISEYCQDARSAMVLGGGLVGLKAAVALAHRGLKVRVMVGSPNVLSQIISAHEAEAFEAHLGEMGVEILARTNPAAILGKGRVDGVETTEGRKFPCELVVVGKGVDANIALVKGTPIKTEYGILVDDHCRTSVEGVYAAGDVAQSRDDVRGSTWMNALWPHAVEEGRVAAENILGRDSTLRPRTSMNSFVIGELAMISCGLTGAREEVEGAEQIAVKGPGHHDRRRLIFKGDRLVGFVLVGKVAHAGVLTSLVTRRINISDIKASLLSGQYDFGSVLTLIRRNREAFNEPEYAEILNFI